MRLELGRRQASMAEWPAAVPEVDPVSGRELRLLDRAPAWAAVDVRRLVDPGDRFGEGRCCRCRPPPDDAADTRLPQLDLT